MNTEYEIRILGINKEEFVKKIKSMGAKHIGDFFPRRYVYDLIPKEEHKWLRLRTNGYDTTLTIKEIKKQSIDSTKELEITVDDFDKTNLLLESLGFKNKGYQENKRSEYILDNIHIDIDKWPMIPEYVELEGLNKKDVINIIKKLGYQEKDCVALGVSAIYTHYGYDGENLKDLNFDMEKDSK
ncbi:MAG TPA: CYTH domain-containing protein [Bacilli bacterium]|nr:CYTH domain-containing protein [Bacilli bacterium]